MRERIAPTPSTTDAGAMARSTDTTRVGAISIVPVGRTHILRFPTTSAVPASPRRPLRMVWTVGAESQSTARLSCRWSPEAEAPAPAL